MKRLALAFLCVFFFCNKAQAMAIAPAGDFVDPTVAPVEMGYIIPGSGGEIDSKTTTYYIYSIYDSVSGSLAPGAELSFFYTLAGSKPMGTFFVGDWPSFLPENSEEVINGQTILKVLFRNLSGETGTFSLALWLTRAYTGDVATRYVATLATPLPAALPLFGVGLVGLGAAARRRKTTL